MRSERWCFDGKTFSLGGTTWGLVLSQQDRGGDTVTWTVLKGLMPAIGNHPSPDSAAERPSLVSLGCHHPSSEHKPPAVPGADPPVLPQTSRSLLHLCAHTYSRGLRRHRAPWNTLAQQAAVMPLYCIMPYFITGLFLSPYTLQSAGPPPRLTYVLYKWRGKSYLFWCQEPETELKRCASIVLYTLSSWWFLYGLGCVSNYLAHPKL